MSWVCLGCGVVKTTNPCIARSHFPNINNVLEEPWRWRHVQSAPDYCEKRIHPPIGVTEFHADHGMLQDVDMVHHWRENKVQPVCFIEVFDQTFFYLLFLGASIPKSVQFLLNVEMLTRKITAAAAGQHACTSWSLNE